MFFTYGFLHGNIIHLGTNVLTLLSLGTPVIREIGPTRFLVLYCTALVGGGAAFAVLGPMETPMVGASGALFGLAGAWVSLRVRDALQRREGLSAFGMALGLPSATLTLLNAAMFALSDGKLAWEAHLGGYVCGLLVTPLLDARTARAAAA